MPLFAVRTAVFRPHPFFCPKIRQQNAPARMQRKRLRKKQGLITVLCLLFFDHKKAASRGTPARAQAVIRLELSAPGAEPLLAPSGSTAKIRNHLLR